MKSTWHTAIKRNLPFLLSGRISPFGDAGNLKATLCGKRSDRLRIRASVIAALPFCAAIAIGSTHADAQTISTYAGNGTAGFSGNGGAATSAEIDFPSGVGTDSSGNLYIADFDNNRVRKVTLSTGIITAFAGNGTVGYSGDGGAAVNAEFEYPYDVAVDSSGNAYISDSSGCRVRKVVPAGTISTIAGNGNCGYSGDGGAATSAELIPTGIAVDSSGNVYIADGNNSRIRKVTVSTGIITTVAGNGTAGDTGDGGAATSAELDTPYGVAVDGSGNIYIADVSANVIRKVTASTGIISRVAGNGTRGYSGDGGAATSAELEQPRGITVDSSANIYIADSLNYRIRKVTASTGIITTYAGDGTRGYSGDGGSPTAAELNVPYDVAVGSSGVIYIADQYNSRIRAVTP
ncbi:NHL repeat-containing protein [Edaphobacter dinghuensis]|uniref:Teneurin NHL domain-containing protein n=1 Tax=Edaphobacter dinghuensis TaxID=1560005 RepID=A0A917HQZ0_9BACT|nr:NHL repeat-containing protein [Edaphobacter dinghuensis]GGG86553.1 hypothetical protein GCM10011585_33130 [Edaphobacter dinghuensis]